LPDPDILSVSEEDFSNAFSTQTILTGFPGQYKEDLLVRGV
jgi:hypothetical protein